MNEIRQFVVGMTKEEKPFIVLHFVWNPRILHFLPSLDIESTREETTIALGWFFFNVCLRVIKQ